jgi:hypothetical protein
MVTLLQVFQTKIVYTSKFLIPPTPATRTTCVNIFDLITLTIFGIDPSGREV